MRMSHNRQRILQYLRFSNDSRTARSLLLTIKEIYQKDERPRAHKYDARWQIGVPLCFKLADNRANNESSEMKMTRERASQG